jgi:hypothetical protein
MKLGDLWDPEDMPSGQPLGEKPTVCTRCGEPLDAETLARLTYQAICEACWDKLLHPESER